MTPPQPQPLRLIVFPGGFNWPVWVAQERGFFADNHVRPEIVLTPGSVFQWTCLAQGDADLVITLMDNVLAYREGQGETDITVPDAVALMALDTRVLPSLVTQPDITSYADLKGKTLSVDAMATGLALALIGMLENGGLRPGDYALERAGGVLQRFEALRSGKHAGALFNSPFEGLLRDQGFHVLDTASGVFPRYQGQVVATRQGWASANRPAVQGFLGALTDAVGWLYAPENRDEAFAIFNRNTPDAPADAAASAYATLFHPMTGFPRDPAIALEDVAGTLALRARYGRPAKRLGEPSIYCDPSFLAEALNPRGRASAENG